MPTLTDLIHYFLAFVIAAVAVAFMALSWRRFVQMEKHERDAIATITSIILAATTLVAISLTLQANRDGQISAEGARTQAAIAEKQYEIETTPVLTVDCVNDSFSRDQSFVESRTGPFEKFIPSGKPLPGSKYFAHVARLDPIVGQLQDINTQAELSILTGPHYDFYYTPDDYARCTLSNIGRTAAIDITLEIKCDFRADQPGSQSQTVTHELEIHGLGSNQSTEFAIFNGEQKLLTISFDQIAYLVNAVATVDLHENSQTGLPGCMQVPAASGGNKTCSKIFSVSDPVHLGVTLHKHTGGSLKYQDHEFNEFRRQLHLKSSCTYGAGLNSCPIDMDIRTVEPTIPKASSRL